MVHNSPLNLPGRMICSHCQLSWRTGVQNDLLLIFYTKEISYCIGVNIRGVREKILKQVECPILDIQSIRKFSRENLIQSSTTTLPFEERERGTDLVNFFPPYIFATKSLFEDKSIKYPLNLPHV